MSLVNIIIIWWLGFLFIIKHFIIVAQESTLFWFLFLEPRRQRARGNEENVVANHGKCNLY